MRIQARVGRLDGGGETAGAGVPVKASGCRRQQEFTVRKADLNRGKRDGSPQAELPLPSVKPWSVTCRQTDPVVPEPEPGEEVVGLFWHGQVVEVRDADGRRQQTSDGPVGWPGDRLGGALACFSFGLPALAGGMWKLFARGDRRHTRAAVVMRCHGVRMAVASLFTLWAHTASAWPFRAVPDCSGLFRAVSGCSRGPLALLGLASMTAFVVAALRGDMDDEAAPVPQPDPTATASGHRL